MTTWLSLYHYAEVITSIQARSPLRRPCAHIEPGTVVWGVDMDLSSLPREPCLSLCDTSEGPDWAPS